ncbi:NTP transferase domain-containing protein [Candidatus Uhrbacteria bacterium]|nr:NTP transferase domain-containing protein [Candidatus Uhrbacteria bacterium]
MNPDVVIVAAGFGFIEPGVSKLTEIIDPKTGISVIGHVIRTLPPFVGNVVLVLNGLYGRQVIESVERDVPPGQRVLTVYQETERGGTADAVRSALPEVTSDEFLVLFADMPLWRTRTVEALIRIHEAKRPTMSMATVALNEPSTPPPLRGYGRVGRAPDGMICGVFADGTDQGSRSVNPSLYIFETRFFRDHVGLIPPRRRTDGYSDEIDLPHLVAVAAKKARGVAEVLVEDPREALGINNAADLATAAAILERRRLQT